MVRPDDPLESAQRELRMAGRALARAGLVHAYGHCSTRIDQPCCLVNAPLPLGLLTHDDEGDVVQIDEPLPDGILGEVRIHQAIYRTRRDVGAICRVTPKVATTLSTMGTTPRARHGFGSYFAPAPPLWSSPALVRDDASAAGVAESLGASAPAVIMRGNGAVVVAETLQRAVVLAWYLEDAARVELEVMQTGSGIGIELTAAEAGQRATWAGGLAERMWAYLTHGDPEAV